jgi:hypothetical protein
MCSQAFATSKFFHGVILSDPQEIEIMGEEREGKERKGRERKE